MTSSSPKTKHLIPFSALTHLLSTSNSDHTKAKITSCLLMLSIQISFANSYVLYTFPANISFLFTCTSQYFLSLFYADHRSVTTIPAYFNTMMQ